MSQHVKEFQQSAEKPTDKEIDSEIITNLTTETIGSANVDESPIKFSGLNIDLSYHCPLECDHCLFEAGPSRSLQGMSDSHIVRVIQSAAEVGTFYSISIGHQEPFVQFDRLCEILRFLKSNFDGYGIAMPTTAVWVKAREFAFKRLSILRDLQVENLMISVDDYHQSQVPLQKCITCASVAQELGMHVTIQCVYSRTSHRLDYYRTLMEPHLDPDKTKWVESPFCPSGRARKALSESNWPQRNYKDGSCNVMQVMYVAPDGSVTPCCGGGLVASGLVMGSLYEKSMAQICVEIEQDPIMNSLASHQGPAGLVETLQKEHPAWKPREYYTGTCHACFEIMNDPSLVEFLRKSYEERKVDLLLQRLYMEVKEGLFASCQQSG